METELSCIPCFVRQAQESIMQTVTDPEHRERLLRQLLRELSDSSWHGSPPVMAQRIHRIIRRELSCEDPYHDIKAGMNQMALQLLPDLRKTMTQQPDPQEAAVRIAIGGNLLDAGAKTQISSENLPQHMRTIWTQPRHGDSAALFQAAEQAQKILYLADNAGEIVLDRVLIETLPTEKITVAVRGAPVINDATLEDAGVAGLTKIVSVVENGSDAPGTVVEDTSDEFRKLWEEADLVIAKGQGNYETLSETTKHVFFLFVVKCPLIATRAGAPIGTLTVKEQGTPQEAPSP